MPLPIHSPPTHLPIQQTLPRPLPLMEHYATTLTARLCSFRCARQFLPFVWRNACRPCGGGEMLVARVEKADECGIGVGK